MVDRHYFLNLKPWSARTLYVYAHADLAQKYSVGLYVYAHADLAQKYSVGLQEIFVSRLCSQEQNSFFLPCLENSINQFIQDTTYHACIFSFFAGSQKQFAVSPAWSKLARFA
jgi:hypothetical protein